MVKFRSWNEDFKCFVYFKNGKYFLEDNYSLKYLKHFDWQNAEQEVNIDDDKYFIGDIGIINYLERDPGSMMGNGCKRGRILKGVVGLDYRGLFIKDDKNCYYIADYKGRGYFNVIGNIHEGLANGIQ